MWVTKKEPGASIVNKMVANDNEISLIEDETFNPLPDLLELNLQNNRVTSINRLVFAGPVNLLEIDLRNNDVDIISDGAFFRLNNLQRLFLHDNNIGEIRKQTFVGLSSLRELYLHGNDIYSILDSTFVHLPQLEQLWLYDNRISCLEPEAFQGLSGVYILNLGDNELFYLPEEVFQPLQNIVYLLLYGNRLKSIDNKPFQNLTRLLQLNFYFNDIRYISEGAMDGSDRLLHFQWNVENDLSKDNALICDCSSRWLYKWMNSRPLYSKVLCGEPEQFRGQEIRSLQDASFGCNSISLQVSVGPSCENHVVRRRECLVLECSSSPRAPVQWSRADGRELRRILPHSCSTGACQSEGVLLGGGDSVLIVEDMQPEDAGYYVCTATAEGVVASQICRVTVGDPPEVLHEPEEELLLTFPGPSVRFPLSIAGDPPPTVQWYHSRDGNRELDVPIVDTGPDSRYLVSQSGTLMILETRLEDQGTYTAVASNGAGEVRIKVRLGFYFSTPCRRDCLNGGVCTTTPVHFCFCPEGFLGRYCEEYTGPGSARPPVSTDSPTLPASDTTSDSATEKPPDYGSYSGSAYAYSGDYSGYYYYDEGSREKRALQDNSDLPQDLQKSSNKEGHNMMDNISPESTKITRRRNKSMKQDWNENSLYPLDFDRDGLTSYGPEKPGKRNRDTLEFKKAPDRYSQPKPMLFSERFNDNEVDMPLNEELHQLDSLVE